MPFVDDLFDVREEGALLQASPGETLDLSREHLKVLRRRSMTKVRCTINSTFQGFHGLG